MMKFRVDNNIGGWVLLTILSTLQHNKAISAPTWGLAGWLGLSLAIFKQKNYDSLKFYITFKIFMLSRVSLFIIKDCLKEFDNVRVVLDVLKFVVQKLALHQNQYSYIVQCHVTSRDGIKVFGLHTHSSTNPLTHKIMYGGRHAA